MTDSQSLSNPTMDPAGLKTRTKRGSTVKVKVGGLPVSESGSARVDVGGSCSTIGPLTVLGQ